MKYMINRIRGCGLHKLMERRTIKGKAVWICVGILTGRGNSSKLLVRLNKTGKR